MAWMCFATDTDKWSISSTTTCTLGCLVSDMSGGAKVSKQPLGHPLDGGVGPHRGEPALPLVSAQRLRPGQWLVACSTIDSLYRASECTCGAALTCPDT